MRTQENKQLRTQVKERLSLISDNKRLRGYILIKEWTRPAYVDNDGVEWFDEEIRPCHTSGRGRFTTNLDYTQQTMWLLNKMGVDFIAGNDAPRGGKCGQFIIIKGVKDEK